MKQSYSEYWLDFIQGKNGPENSKLCTYCKFKEKFKIENYLLMIDDKYYHSIFTILRISSHQLKIETGRHNKPKNIETSKRFCIYCTSCSTVDYTSHRTILLDKLYNILPNLISITEDYLFIYLLQCLNMIHVRLYQII